jgi:hypothetical protein
MYTNKTASNLNLNLYSKLVGGNKCVKHCRTKCKKKCKGICKISYDDSEEQKISHDKLTAELDRLKALDKELSSRHAESSLYYGGRRRRTRKRKGGFFFLGNSSNLSDCENGCSTECSNSCPILCDNAVSNISKHKENNEMLKEMIADKKRHINTLYRTMGLSTQV